MHSVQVDRS